MKVHINGLDIYCRLPNEQTHFDNDKPVVVVLPGGPGAAHDSYFQQHQDLHGLTQFLYFDPRGCGQSEKCLIEQYTMDNYIKDIEALRQHFGLKKIMLLGISYGCMTAIGYATLYQQFLDKLILVVGAASHRFIEDAKQNLADRGTAQQIAIAEKLWRGNFKDQTEVDNFSKIMSPLYSTKHAENPNNRNMTFPGLAIDPLNHGFATFMRTFDFEPQLPSIKTNTLIIAGKYDWIIDPKQTQILADAIPNNRYIVMDAGHRVSTDQHQLYIEELTKFIKPAA